MQAVSASPDVPDITCYRNSTKAALAWMKEMIKRGQHKLYLLRHAEAAWDVYDASGQLAHLCSDVVFDHVRESDELQTVDRGRLVASVEALVGGPLTVLACAEGHAGASAVDHSNLVVMGRVMLMESSEKDLEHVYMVDDHHYDCRVIGFLARAQALSLAAADKILDRYQWLRNGWPLHDAHHAATLAAKLASVRLGYTQQIVRAAVARSHGEEEADEAMFLLSVADIDKREALARFLIAELREGMDAEHVGSAEVFSDEILHQKTDAIVGAYRKALA